jgi:hypothetical protein
MRDTDSDRGRAYFRSETRIFRQNGAWYFASREGEHGPFERRSVAEREASQHTADCASWSEYQQARSVKATVDAELILTPRNAHRAARFRSWGRLAFKQS